MSSCVLLLDTTAGTIVRPLAQDTISKQVLSTVASPPRVRFGEWVCCTHEWMTAVTAIQVSTGSSTAHHATLDSDAWLTHPFFAGTSKRPGMAEKTDAPGPGAYRIKATLGALLQLLALWCNRATAGCRGKACVAPLLH